MSDNRCRVLGINSSPRADQGITEMVMLIERAGSEAVSTGAVSEGTIETANRDHIEDPVEYDEQLNERFHRRRRESGLEP